MNLSPEVLPHSYRFLPNSIVRWMQISGMSFETARDVYRLIAGLLLFYVLYRYARLFTDYTGAVIAMLLVAVIYPVSFEYSAGQLTDPLSHLSFLLALIFLETGEFGFLLTTLLIGSLAKETILAMAAYYVLFSRHDKQYMLKAAVLCVASVAAYIGVRLFVLGALSQHGYREVSNVSPAHFWQNCNGGRWPAIVAANSWGADSVLYRCLESYACFAQASSLLFAAGAFFIEYPLQLAVRRQEFHAGSFCAGGGCRKLSWSHARPHAGVLKNSFLPLETAERTDVCNGEREQILILIPATGRVGHPEVELPDFEAEAAAVRVVRRLNKVVEPPTQQSVEIDRSTDIETSAVCTAIASPDVDLVCLRQEHGKRCDGIVGDGGKVLSVTHS